MGLYEGVKCRQQRNFKERMEGLESSREGPGSGVVSAQHPSILNKRQRNRLPTPDTLVDPRHVGSGEIQSLTPPICSLLAGQDSDVEGARSGGRRRVVDRTEFAFGGRAMLR